MDVPRIIESAAELPTPDVDDLTAGAPHHEEHEPADIDNAGGLDDGES